jgi:hypothetical protein
MSNDTGGETRVRDDGLKKSSTAVRQISLRRIQNLIVANQRLHNPCLDLSALRSLHSSFSNTLIRNSVSRIHTHLRNPHRSLLRFRLRLRFLCLFNGSRFPNPNIFSTVHSKLRACSEVLGVEVKRRKSEECCVRSSSVICRLSLPVLCLVTHKNWPIHWSAYNRTFAES